MACAGGLDHLDGTMLRMHAMMTCAHLISFGCVKRAAETSACRHPMVTATPLRASMSASDLLCCTEPNPVLGSTRTLHQKALLSLAFWRTQQRFFINAISV